MRADGAAADGKSVGDFLVLITFGEVVQNFEFTFGEVRRSSRSFLLLKISDDFVRDGRTDWTGVRNFQARNNLRQMETGDRVLFYHSGKGKCVVGIAEVARAAYPDPTSKDPQWVAVDLKPLKSLSESVPLTSIRYHAKLGKLPLIRQSQLSVMPLTKEEFTVIVGMGSGNKRRKWR